MCRALKVLCVAPDAGSLARLKAAAVSAEWELVAGATDEREALRQLREKRPHVLVVFGPFERFVASALEANPNLRVVADREIAGAGVVRASLGEVRDLILGRSPPSGHAR